MLGGVPKLLVPEGLIDMKLEMAEAESDRTDSSLLTSVQKSLRTISKTHIHVQLNNRHESIK